MRSGRLFWGVFFVTLGLLFLADRTGIMSPHWGVALGLWPLVLLFWGIALLVGGKAIRLIAAGLAGIVLAYLVVTLFSFSAFEGGWMHGGPEPQYVILAEPPDTSVHKASFALESGAGVFSIEDTTTDLVNVNTFTNFGSYTLDRTEGASGPVFTASLEGKKKGWRLGKFTNRVATRLHTGPSWDLELNIGAAKLMCDLTPFAVERLDVNAGASSMRITLGSRAKETTAHISAGASSIKIYVPESAACEVRVETALSSKHFPGFSKMGDGVYQTENFGTATNTISLDIEAGVSSITVERY